MPPKRTSARAAAKAAPVVNGISVASKKRKAADDDANGVVAKKAKAVDTALKDLNINDANRPKTTKKAVKPAAKRAEATVPVFSIEPKTTLTDFQNNPPDASSLPTINEAPTDVLTVYVFGTGDMSGDLGLGPNKKLARGATTIPKLDPKEADSYRVVQLDCGGMHTVALTEDSKIVTWGGNDLGALGRDSNWEGGLRDMDEEPKDDSDSDDEALNPLESTPTHIPEDTFPPNTKFTCVAAGDSCSFAVTTTGLVYGWGTFQVSPAGLSHITTIYTDSFFQDAEANKCFLYYKGEKIQKQEKPMLIPGLQNIKLVVAGANHALALDKSGRVWSWGVNEKTQVGRRLHAQNDFLDNFYPGMLDLSRYGIKSLAAGPHHSLAVDNKDRVFAWGANNYGTTGYPQNAGADGATLPYPLQIRSLSKRGIEILAAGEQHSAAVTADGQCLVWGYIDYHNGFKLTPEQIADPKMVLRDERDRPRILLQPVAVPDIGEAAYVACSRSHTVFINREGKAFASGFGSESQLGNGSDDDNETAKEVKGKAIKGVKLTWCGTGGQWSMVAAPASGNQTNGTA